MKKIIKNPVLPGFNPDPCMIRVEDTYYIAVSSFEWLAGVRIYESKDLVNWEYCTDALTNQIDLSGDATGCGIWAPQLSYAEGEFHLIYTDVKSSVRPFKDTPNYIISSPSIHGPWSEPVYLNSSGFDPSLFHDEDGRKWLSNALWDYRLSTPNKSSGIVIQEYDAVAKRLIGEPVKIFDMTDLAKTEAPHIYKVHGYYYLVMAEGGTGSGHAVTVARSKNVTGPYEVDPHYPMMTARNNPESPIQCSGHASLVETPAGEWYIAHLGTRPLKEQRAILGRETFIQKVVWDDEGWLRLAHGGVVPALEVEVPKEFTGEIKEWEHDFYDDFSGPTLKENWNSLRMMPNKAWCSLTERENHLRIYGGESLHSLFKHHLLAIRQTNFNFTASTKLTFEPKCFLQMAGLLLFLNAENYLYTYLTREDDKNLLRVLKADKGAVTVTDSVVELPQDLSAGIELSVATKGETANIYYRLDNQEDEQHLYTEEDLSFLSGGFTGNFVGIACHDMNMYKGCYADFEYFNYKTND